VKNLLFICVNEKRQTLQPGGKRRLQNDTMLLFSKAFESNNGDVAGIDVKSPGGDTDSSVGSRTQYVR